MLLPDYISILSGAFDADLLSIIEIVDKLPSPTARQLVARQYAYERLELLTKPK